MKSFEFARYVTQENYEECFSSYSAAEEIPYDEADGFDYQRHTLKDLDSGEFLYDEDNIHGNPDDYFEGFEKALKLSGIEYKIVKVVKLD